MKMTLIQDEVDRLSRELTANHAKLTPQPETCSDCQIGYNNTAEAIERARLRGIGLDLTVVLCPRHSSAKALYEAAKLALHAGTVCCGWDGDMRGQSTKDAADLLRTAIEAYEKGSK